MKAKDFMINDWVKWTFDIEPKHRQIFSIITEENADGSKEYYADLGDGEIYKDLFPIPLTTEILEKNGFSYDYEDGWEFAGKDYEPIISCVLEGSFVQIESRGLVAELRIQYVHELQHALRLCGLNDLADNFKF